MEAPSPNRWTAREFLPQLPLNAPNLHCFLVILRLELAHILFQTKSFCWELAVLVDCLSLQEKISELLLHSLVVGREAGFLG